MLSKMHTPESCCVEPEHFRDYFRAFYWTSQRSEKRCRKRISKRERRKARVCAVGGAAPAMLANPSRFAAFAAARAAVLARWTQRAAVASDRSDDSDSEDHSPLMPLPCAKLPKITGIGLRTVFALVAQARTANAAFCELALKAMLDVLQGHAPEELHQEPCEIIQSLHNMLAEVSGGAMASSSVVSNSGGLSNSPGTSNNGGTIISGVTVSSSAINNSGGMSNSGGTVNSAGIYNRGGMHSSVATSNIAATSTSLVPGGGGAAASALTAVAGSCLVALAVARGDAELLLSAAACLLVSPPHLADQRLTVPANLVTLQRSVQTALLGSCARNSWLNYGVPAHSIFSSFTIDVAEEAAGAEGAGGACRALASDGSFLYVHTSRGLLKLGSGYGGTVRAHLYQQRADFFPGERHSWLGCCKNKLYVRMGRKKSDIYQVDKDTLEVDGVLQLDPGPGPLADSKAFIFTDGTNLGMISVASQDVLSVKLYSATGAAPAPLTPHRELSLHLLRRRTLALGAPPYEELRRRALDSPDAPHAALIDDTDEERALSIAAGQDFALLRTASGKVYYTGKAASLGYKVPNPPSGKWCLMRETQYSRNDPQNAIMSRIVQVALGHEGLHAVLVAEDGGVLFVGMARRGEDGDLNRHRRQPKPSKPKKMAKLEAYHITYAACNYGSTALVTRQGALLMFGKDTQHCDTLGVVGGLRHERIVQVALGKAHAVALTATGLVYTFGINNRGQCGRELGYTKEKHGHRGTSANHNAPPVNHNAPRLCAPSDHLFEVELCRVCVLCHECTGFSTGCRCADRSSRAPREICGCGQGDSGCGVCGVCRRCAGCYEMDEDELPPSADGHNAKESHKYDVFECDARSGCGDAERESTKVTCLPPARVAVPGGHKITQVACGLHHTVLLTDHGEVMTFGANQLGQLGAGNLSAHHRIVRVRVPRAAAVAAGSNHTVVRTRDGELYTFGNYQGGALGRDRPEEAGGAARAREPLWHASPGKVTRLGPGNATRVVWASASGDQTFVQVSQTLLKPDTLYMSTITANKNTIVILPNRSEHTFKCITINKVDGSCKSHAGPEQVDFGGALACLDPLYDVMWCYRPHARLVHCYNILAFDTHTLQRCAKRERRDDTQYPNYGPMKKIEEFKNLETIESVCTDEDHRTEGAKLLSMSILNQELAIPCVGSSQITRMHAAMHLLGCMDTLTFAQDCNRLSLVRCKCDYPSTAGAGCKEDFLVVNRFESHGGGWGYSGHSVEAIRFMVDTDLLLGGFGLFGGRGDYTAKIKLLDLGVEGGEHEGEGELLAESDEIVFECPPREKYPVLFDLPVPLVPNRWYVAWATINGPSSDCGSSGQMMVVTDDAVFHFKTSKKSNNGTDVNAGQIPCLLYSTASADQSSLVTRGDYADSYIVLSKKISRKITAGCFRSLITLLQWAWTSLKRTLMDTSGSVPISHKKLQQMKHQRRLTYIVRACTRILKSYINEERKRTSNHLMYSDVIVEVRSLLQSVLAEAAPTCWTPSNKKAGRGRVAKLCTVTFQLELTDAALKECHRTILSCFDAFFPTPAAKWAHLCSLLYHVKEGIVPASKVRELTATVAALCVSKSLREILHYVVPISQNYSLTDGHQSDEALASKSVKMETPTKSKASGSKPPPVPPRANSKDAQLQRHQQLDITESRPHSEWGLTDALPRLLDAALAPARAARPAGHDHGERALAERLAAACGKLLARLVAELAYASTESREEGEVREANAACLTTPSRFMRTNTSRSWNTGNGSPDAIGFAVDRPGVMIVGAGVYGGLANHDYELELLHDVRSLQPTRAATEDGNPAHCWFSVDVTHGTYTPADCHNDIAQLKFNRPIPLKEGVRYALRFCNHGGRTSNGDCGLPSVKGPDGTTFRFSSCSLSFNGSTLARGQLPTILYCRSAAAANDSSENKDVIESAIRSTTLKVASVIVDRTVELFRNLRNEVSAEELPARAQLLQRSPAVSVLVPYTLANLSGLNDPKSVVARLEMVRRLLPEVAAARLACAAPAPAAASAATATAGAHYAWVESEHPYSRQATVTNLRVLFPARVAWVALELDPASATAQPEDALTVYAAAGGARHHCHCAPRLPAHAARKGIQQKLLQLDSDEAGIYERTADDSLCLEYDSTYVAVTPKMSNSISEWPQKALLIPGNEVIFSLETATDYLNEFKSNGEDARFGFRALCVGYEAAPSGAREPALSALEMELAYAGAACAAELLSPELDIPPLGPASALELRQGRGAGEARALWEQHEASLLARGLQLSDPPTVQHILTGQPLSQCQSTERLFLADLVSGAPLTAGGRLAEWLQPGPRVQPSRCDVRLPGAGGGVPRVGTPLLIGVAPRDQRGDLVRSPALKVEVAVQLAAEGAGAGAGGARRPPPDCRTFGGRAPPPVREVPYAPVARDNVLFHAITIMKAYVHYSFEELRAAARPEGARVPPERLPVRPQLDGGYVASWMPRAAGLYVVECTLDDVSVRQDLTVEVKEQISAGLPSTSAAQTVQASEKPLPTRPTKLRKFCVSETAGLRVRAHPSLQSEEIGVIPPDANIAFTEEVQNNDGTWLRLSPAAVRLFVEGGGASAVAATALAADPPHAWCLQYHQQLERTLLEPLEAQLFTAKTDDIESRPKPMQQTISPSNSHSEQDSENDNEESEDSILFSSLRLRKGFNFRGNSESDSDVNIFNFTKKHAVQPSQSTSDDKARTFVFEPKEEEDDEKSIEMLSPKPKSPGQFLRHIICHSKNGNGCSDWDDMPSPEEDDDDDDETTTNMGNQQEGRLTQTGTQTSPDTKYEDAKKFSVGSSSKQDDSPRRPERRARPQRAAAGLAAPPRPPPRPYALSPSQAECYRALFAALLWHEGIVHDAMACAAFLKFHPELPKEGFKVVTRTASAGSDFGAASRALKQQRHSVEVSNAGQYLHIQPSTLESLTRSANNASANRSRGKRVDAAGPPISEEETLGSGPQVVTLPAPTTVNVLPPALRALVALWDTLSDARELGVNPDKYMKEDELEKIMCGVDRKLYNFNSRAQVKKEYRATSSSEALYTVCCELCDGLAVAPPLAAHMGLAHPGCRAPCCKGYDRLGCYVDAGPSLTPCGQLAQEYSNGACFNSSHAKAGYYLWYMYCERCRDKSIKASAGQPKPRAPGDRSLEMLPPPSTAVFDHYEMLENATFLLELVPATSSGSGGIIAGSPPTPASSPWVPAPPFQSLDSLGVNPFLEEELTEQNQEALIREWEENGMGGVYHELIEGYGIDQLGQIPGLLHPTHAQRFHRSVSMGQAGCTRDLASEGRALFMRHHEINVADTSGSSASLLATPSAALQKLVGLGRPASNRATADNLCSISAFETPALDRAALLNRPVLTFVRGKRDLHVVRQKMDAAVRISTVRQYALEALNWLLRSVTQPVSLHDIMWWFCSALDQFGKYDCTNDNIRRNMGAAEGACGATESWAVAGGDGGGRAALHALLQSVAELMPSLPPTCAALLQAVRCWALHFASADHALLHRSQVFSVISKILSHTEEDLYEESVVGLMPDEGESISCKEGFTWHCRDVTAWCVVSVSSRAAAASALTDGSTDTFWESGDEERTEPKWIQVTCPSGVLDEKPHIICLHIDNTRDTGNKTLMVTFLYSGNSTDLFQMQEVEVDVKSATWVQYSLPRNAVPPLRIRCELRGPDPTVRVRQVKVLALPSLRPGAAAAGAASASHYKSALERAQPAALILHQTIEQETLRVFRLITSQVFGKLLEWGSGSGSDGDGGASLGGDADPAESDLRERLVGILFSGSKMTSLQKQVMSHVVAAVGVEARRARDEWESAAAAAGEGGGAGAADGAPASPDPPDTTSLHNYCFEMLSLLLALSGSQVGLEHLAKRLELLPDLMSLLHTGSDRSQRQVISLLQRLIGEISPPKMLSALNPGNDGTVLRVSLVDHLATYVCKAISVQVKAKGAVAAGAARGEGGGGGGGAGSPRAPAPATAGGSVAPLPPGFWFMRGQTSKKLAQLVVRLLRDMAEERVSAAWGAETRAALAQYTVRLAGVPDAERGPGRCVAGAPMWLALAALCVIEESYTELIAPGLRADSGEARARRASDARESRPYCANHDDGETLAVVDCRSCGPLCHECDRCLHLNRAARTHHRQICKEEESTIRVDIHEGCGRAKLFWLLLLVDRRTLKALAEFRGAAAGAQPPPEEPAALPGPPGLAGVCRFCGARGNTGLLAIGNVCADQECQDHSQWACARVLACGHLCGGARGERRCLPCLYGCEAAPALRQDADDMCMICFTEPLAAAPALQLQCGHVFHLHCCKKVLGNKWNGPRITFSFSQCPICKEDMEHEMLEELLVPLRRLQEEVCRKALMRLEYEGLPAAPASRPRTDLAAYAMERYAYYVCFKCDKAYFGGLARCDAESSMRYDPSELVCGACSDVTGARTCAKHGADFLEYKCRYCCSVAVFFCFGTSHFCNTCHDDFQRVTNITKHALPQCPAGPKARQLEGTSDDCPLHMQHPPTGEEFALGCGVCRNSQNF